MGLESRLNRQPKLWKTTSGLGIKVFGRVSVLRGLLKVVTVEYTPQICISTLL